MSIINLLPEDYLKRREQQRANILCLILFGIVMVGVVGAAVVSEEKAARARRDFQQVSEEYRKAGELIAQMQQLEAKKKQWMAKAQMASELLERVPRSYLLACLTNALPRGGSLTDVKLATIQPKPPPQPQTDKNKFKSRAAARAPKKEEEAPAAKPSPPKVTLEVTGLAETDVQVAQFIANMRANPLMKSVELVFSEQKDIAGTGARRFQVTMELKSDAQVDVQLEGQPGQPSAELAAQPTERAN